MSGCMCGCRGMGYGPQFARWPSRENRVESLEEYQRDLEQRVAEVADEIERLKNESRPTSKE
jgi:predicted RNase H-like nuclease (RuvC/YqgF family)